VRLRVRVAGPEAAPALLLLHGLTEYLEVWWERGWAQALAGRHRVIAFDARGHGASSKPHAPARYRADVIAADAIAVLDDLGCDSASAVGYSTGGGTALLLAAGAAARIRRLAVGGTSALGQSHEPLRRALAGGLQPLLAAIERQCGALPDPVRLRFLANDPASLAAACAEDRADLSDALARFAGPAMFFVAERDALRPAVEAGARRLGWACHVIPGRNHFDLSVSGAALPVVAEFLAQG
jgi:pimeloyl-ACP methyl ester carboxylesterase